MDKQISRLRATIAGAVAGMSVAIFTVVVGLSFAAVQSPQFVKHGLTGLSFVMLVLPGTMLIGSVFAFPTAVAMVFSVTALARKLAWFDAVWAWIAAGILFASPTAYLFSFLDRQNRQFDLVSIWSFFLAVGAVAGLFAWLFRYPKHNGRGPIAPEDFRTDEIQ